MTNDRQSCLLHLCNSTRLCNCFLLTSVANWYIYIPNWKSLVYFQTAWYINFDLVYMKNLVYIWYILVKGLVEILNQFISFITKRTHRSR